jgi:hypothetical protein
MPLTRGQIVGHDTERLALWQFLSLRDTIERIASDLFDEAPTIQGYVIRIFMKHLRR